MSESQKPRLQPIIVLLGIGGSAMGIFGMCVLFFLVLFVRGCFIGDAEERLFSAASNGDMATVERLVAQGVDINGDHMDWRKTPLMAATHSGHTDIIRFLLNHHADVNRRDNNGTDALHEAIENHHPDIVRLLKAAGAKE